jgi:hypothetical protein
MLRRISFLTLAVSLTVFGAAADGKKKAPTTSTKTTTLTTSTTTISASEGSTAMAIRGIVGTEGPTGIAVLGFDPGNGIVTARNRQSGGTFKFKVPANSSVHLGDNVNGDLNGSVASVSGLAGRFNVYAGSPCCEVAAINAANHTFSVREAAVGRTFVVNVEPPNEMRIGQRVEADFKAGTAWISGNTALKGKITNLSQPTGLHP